MSLAENYRPQTICSKFWKWFLALFAAHASSLLSYGTVHTTAKRTSAIYLKWSLDRTRSWAVNLLTP